MKEHTLFSRRINRQGALLPAKEAESPSPRSRKRGGDRGCLIGVRGLVLLLGAILGLIVTGSSAPPLRAAMPEEDASRIASSGADASRGASLPEVAAPHAQAGREALSEAEARKLLDEAVADYQSGDFEAAARLFERVLEGRGENGALHYNLGNTYYRMGDLGRAIYHYRLAQLFSPRDADLRANLELARGAVQDALERKDASAVKTLFFWYDWLSESELFWSVVVTNALFWSLLGWRKRQASIGALLVILGIVTSSLLGTYILRRWNEAHNAPGVILAEQASVRSGTDVRSVRLFVLHAGTEVETHAHTKDWIQIELPDGRRGWVERALVGLIVPRRE